MDRFEKLVRVGRTELKAIRGVCGIGWFMFVRLYGGPSLGLGLYAYLLYQYKLYYLPAGLYALWYLYDINTPHRGGVPNNDTLESGRVPKLWNQIRSFIPFHVVRTSPLPADKNYLLVCHPHGLVSLGPAASHCTQLDGQFPGLRTLLAVLNPLLYIPFFREYLVHFVHCIGVDRGSLQYALTKSGPGIGVLVMVGGAREILEDGLTIVLRRRKGFVRLALQTGTDLVPLFVFGETELFQQLHQLPGWAWLKSWQLWMIRLFGFPLLLPTSLLPKRHPIHAVVGSPIPVERVENPTQSRIDRLHQDYIQSLEQLFEEHKTKYGYPHQHLNII